jgi:hypothetical protein
VQWWIIRDGSRTAEGEWKEIGSEVLKLEQRTEKLARREGESDSELLGRASEGKYVGYEKQEVEAQWKMGGIEVRCKTVQRLD